MAGNSLVRTDESRISKLDQALNRVEEFLVLLSGIAVAALVMIAVISVTGRAVFGQPLAGYIDWIEQFMPVIAFTGISYALRNGAHIRMDMLIVRIKGRPFYALELFTTTLTFIFIVLMVWGSWSHFGRSFDWAQPLFSRDSSMDIGMPLWPSKLLVPVSFSVMILRAILQMCAYFVALRDNVDVPVAVPLIPDITEQAAAEANQLLGKD